jgi:hypothetical protein
MSPGLPKGVPAKPWFVAVRVYFHLPAPLHNVELFGRAPIKKKGSSMIKQLLKIHLARFGCGPWRLSALNLNVSNLFCTNCFESQLIHVHFQSDI